MVSLYNKRTVTNTSINKNINKSDYVEKILSSLCIIKSPSQRKSNVNK